MGTIHGIASIEAISRSANRLSLALLYLIFETSLDLSKGGLTSRISNRLNYVHLILGHRRFVRTLPT